MHGRSGYTPWEPSEAPRALSAEPLTEERARITAAIEAATEGKFPMKHKYRHPKSTYDPLIRESVVLRIVNPEPTDG